MPATITREKHFGVVHIVINRPEARNSIDGETARQLEEAFIEVESDSSSHVIVLSGAGQGFSAGLDLKAFADHGDVGETSDRGFAGITRRTPDKPVIAAVEGFALAGGFEIALACDLIIAAEDARMGLPEVTRGLVADGGALIRLPERLPLAIAMEMSLLGEEIAVEKLHRWGIVNHVVSSGQAVDAALSLASKIAMNAPLATAATKQILSRSSRADEVGSWQVQRDLAFPVWQSMDAQEGARAFAEKREPRFLGK